jgi:predicted small secreted protein
MLPARVKATTGLLIEPHILERSKIAQKDPTGEDYQKETVIHYDDTTILTAENNQYESIIDADLSDNLTGENNQYESIIDANLSESLIADSYQYDGLIDNNDTTITNAESYQQEVIIDAGLDEPTITTEINLGVETYGQSAYETIGFGIYAEQGTAIRTYFDTNNKIVKQRVLVNLVTEQKERIITKFAVTASNGLGDPRGGYVPDIQTYTETKLNIQPFSGSTIPTVKGSIIAVQPVDGYLPTHYRNTSDLTRGLQNSYFRGSKNTAATTLDGTSPIETFVSNPNTLTVNKTGRNTSEPILQVE